MALSNESEPIILAGKKKSFEPTASKVLELFAPIKIMWLSNGKNLERHLPVSKWHDLFEDSTVADAVLDRLVHNVYRFGSKGPTRRRLEPDSNTKNADLQPASSMDKVNAKIDMNDTPWFSDTSLY